MNSIHYVAAKINEYFGSEKSPELTARRKRELKSTLGILYRAIMIGGVEDILISDKYNVKIQTILKLTWDDLRDVGEMEFIFNRFFPQGDIPEDLRKYKNFVDMVKNVYGDRYVRVVESKLLKDRALLDRIGEGRDVLEDMRDPIYGRSLVGIIDAEEIKRDKNRLVVMYGLDVLYEENIPEDTFIELPSGATVVFNYTSQKLNLDLKRTLEENSKAKKDRSTIERVVLETLVKDTNTMKYLDDVYDQINEELNK